MKTAEGIALTRQLLSLLESTPALSEIEFKCEDTHIRLTGRSVDTPNLSRTPSPESQETLTKPQPASAGPESERSPKTSQVIKAELHGVFYLSPSPGAAPFVLEGDKFDEGQQIAIIEAMKMLNVVEAPQNGRIIRVLVKDGEVVTPGTSLFETEVA